MLDTKDDRRQVVDMCVYMAKCNDFEQLKAQYVAKCRDYDQLSERHKSLEASSLRPDTAVRKQNTAKQQVLPVRLQTFEDFEAVEESMMAPGSGSRGRRIIAAISPPNVMRIQGDLAGMKHRGSGSIDVTPTKRARKAADTAGNALPRLLSSPLNGPCRPLLYNKQREWRKAGSKEEKRASTKPATKPRQQPSGKQPLVLSSQETQLDFSDLVLPTEPAEQLCPPSDQECTNDNKKDRRGRDEMWRAAVEQEVVEGNKKVEDWVKKTREYVGSSKAESKKASSNNVQTDDGLQRILDAVSDCDECKAFYSVPGLVLPKRDPHTLCAHRSRSRNSKDGSAQASRRALEAPRSEQKRPTTPDHFWDIDYFPPIRTGGPELLRKSKQR
ncbi:hypothetical protein LPJ59_000649 [Coemansia sp. RSA 2399]|nr:hypothetical protein LPJ59_000649 [Coemansia sp. RSA 2399]KAJ1907796.1 hypothetical protein LPJ81_000525 [Coemansia sp. IMI 209127]